MRAASASLGAVENPSKEDGAGAEASSPSAANAMDARRRVGAVKTPTSARIEVARRMRADDARATRAVARAWHAVARRAIVGVAACIGRARASVAMVGGAMSEDIRVSAGTSFGRARFIATCLLHRRALSRIEVALIETERNSEVSVDVGVDEAVRAVRDGHALVVQNRTNDILRVGESVRDDR